MDSRLDYSLRCTTAGAGANPLVGQTSTAVGWTEQTYVGLLSATGSNATEIFTSNGHGMVAGDTLYFSALTGGTGLTLGQVYYVINPTTNTFQISATFGGAAVNFTTDVTESTIVGPETTVTHTLYMTPDRYGESWSVSRVTVNNTSETKVPTASIYRGVLSPSSLVDVTQNGTNDVDDLLTPIHLTRGEAVIIQFTGCQPPAYAGYMTSVVFIGGTVSYN